MEHGCTSETSGAYGSCFPIKKGPFYISGYHIAGGLLWSPRITTGRLYLDEPHSLVKIIDGIKQKA